MQQDKVEEVILKKTSFFKTKINEHVVDTILNYTIDNKENFKSRTWNCNILTSKNLCKNILYHLTEFKYVREHIENAIKNLLRQTFNNETPFMIHDSWLNILDKNGYQEFHRHTEDDGSGVLYLTDDNSAIEFAIFPDDLRTQFQPKKCDLILFDSSTFHRVLESKQERFSLAFNFKVGK